MRDAIVDDSDVLNAIFVILSDIEISPSRYSIGLIARILREFVEYPAFQRFLAAQTDLPSIILQHVEVDNVCEFFLDLLSSSKLDENIDMCQLLDGQQLIQRLFRCLLENEADDVMHRKAVGEFLARLLFRLRYLRSIEKGNVHILLAHLEG